MASKTEKNNKLTNKSKSASNISSKNNLINDQLNQKISELNTRIASLTETNRQLTRKMFDLYSIVEISRNFNAVLDYEVLLDTFILTSIAQVGATKAVLLLKEDTDSDRFVLTISKGVIETPIEEIFIKDNTPLLEHITKLNRPEPIAQLIDNIATQSEKQFLTNFNPGLIVPLLYQYRLSGILIIADKISNRDFRLDDIEFLSILGNQISVAIENARLYKAEKMATNKLLEAQEKLINSERLAALGEMSAKVAHEINNPLGIIKNYILLLQRSIKKNKNANEYAGIVGQEIDRIAQIVRELLDFHRPTSFDFKPINPVPVIEDVLHFMERQLAKQNIKLQKKYPEHCPKIVASPENLKQVFINLILNAIDVMPNGGNFRLAVIKLEDHLKITVCDSGPGISDEIIPRIFEPFFTTKEPGKGTGLGLSVCYGIIKRHKGSITYRNNEMGGGCFEICLPLPEKK